MSAVAASVPIYRHSFATKCDPTRYHAYLISVRPACSNHFPLAQLQPIIFGISFENSNFSI